jgi:hypothetical protein
VTHRGENSSWGEFAQTFRDAVSATKDGTGIYFLSATITSPTLARQWQAVQKAYPKAKLVQYDPAIAGTAFASGVTPRYELKDANVIVSLDADFLSGATYPGFHKLVGDYARRRKDPNNLNRVYAVESSPTTTGFKAEHRLGLRASEVPAFAAALAQAVGVSGVPATGYTWTDEQQKFLQALAKDLKAHAGKSAVIPGLYQDPSVTALATAINQALGNVGKTVMIASQPLNPLPSEQIGDLKALVADLNAGKVQWLVILNSNPVYNAPSDLYFSDALERATTVAHLGSHIDETGLVSHWHIPAAHALEMWSDGYFRFHSQSALSHPSRGSTRAHSSMANLATGQLFRRADLVMLQQEMPQLILARELLVIGRHRNRRPAHIPRRRHLVAARWRRLQKRHRRRRSRRRLLRHAIHLLRRRPLLRLHRAPHRPVFIRRFPRHVVNLARRPQILRRIPMAVQAPLHLQRVLHVHQRHLVHAPMAARAPNALVHVNGVIEVCKIRQVVHLGPLHRLVGRPAMPNRLQQLCIRPDLRVTVDARLGRRYPRNARLLHRRVTVLALQPQSLHMVLVAERNRLVRPLPLAGHPWRTLQLVQRHSQGNNDQPRQHKAHPGQSVGAAVKYLRHEYVPALLRCFFRCAGLGYLA